MKPIVVAAEHEPVATLARKLRDGHVGCVVVTRSGRPIGVVTDRDIAVRVVAEGLDPNTTPAAEVVTYDPVVVHADDGIETALAEMRAHGIRRLPIVDGDGAVVGIVTSDDLVLLIGRELGDLCDGIEGAADAYDAR